MGGDLSLESSRTDLREETFAIIDFNSNRAAHSLHLSLFHFDYLRLSTGVPSLDGLTSYLLSLLFYMITIANIRV